MLCFLSARQEDLESVLIAGSIVKAPVGGRVGLHPALPLRHSHCSSRLNIPLDPRPKTNQTHRIRMASSPNGSLLRFFSSSFAFFFFFKPFLSFSFPERERCSWRPECCCCWWCQALESPPPPLLLSLAPPDRCLAPAAPPPSRSAHCRSPRRRCLKRLTARRTASVSARARPTARAMTTHSHAGEGSIAGRRRRSA